MKKILILAGGYSKEKEVSIQTAKSVYSELNKDRKYKIKVVNPDGKFVKLLRNFNPNIVLNLLHGRYGEDGYIQAILESEKVKYTHSGVLSSSLAIDKELSKKIFIKNKILTPKYLKFSYRNNINKLKLIKKYKATICTKTPEPPIKQKEKNLAEIILPNLDCHNNSKYSHNTNESSLDSP